jgi:hypothetical protein
LFFSWSHVQRYFNSHSSYSLFLDFCFDFAWLIFLVLCLADLFPLLYSMVLIHIYKGDHV